MAAVKSAVAASPASTEALCSQPAPGVAHCGVSAPQHFFFAAGGRAIKRPEAATSASCGAHTTQHAADTRAHRPACTPCCRAPPEALLQARLCVVASGAAGRRARALPGAAQRVRSADWRHQAAPSGARPASAVACVWPKTLGAAWQALPEQGCRFAGGAARNEAVQRSTPSTAAARRRCCPRRPLLCRRCHWVPHPICLSRHTTPRRPPGGSATQIAFFDKFPGAGPDRRARRASGRAGRAHGTAPQAGGRPGRRNSGERWLKAASLALWRLWRQPRTAHDDPERPGRASAAPGGLARRRRQARATAARCARVRAARHQARCHPPPPPWPPGPRLS